MGTENELLKDEIDRLRQERDQWRAQAEKLSLLFEAEREYWQPIAFRLDGRSLNEIMDENESLKDRLAGNMAGKGHLSDELQDLRRVAEQVWANVDPSDPSSHPKNCIAETCLIRLGWSPDTARRGASLIRPSWARRGRPEED